MRRNPDKPLRSKTPLRATKRLGPGAKAKERAKRTGSALRRESRSATARRRVVADDEWKAVIRALYGEYCVLCGRRAKICHHAYPKGAHPELRHVVENGFVLCWKDHTLTHASPEQMRAFQRVVDERVRRGDMLTLDEVRAMLKEADDGQAPR